MEQNDFARLKQKAEEHQKAIDRRQGALDELHRRLKDEFGHDGKEAAMEEVDSLAIEEENLKKAVAREEAKIRTECPELFQ